MSDLFSFLTQSFKCKCPRCGEGDLFQPGLLNMNLNEKCSGCGLELARNDSADGPAVFLIFILGFLIVPAALLLDHLYQPSLWIHMLIWGPLCLALIFGMLKPTKSFVLALLWKHRATDWTRP